MYVSALEVNYSRVTIARSTRQTPAINIVSSSSNSGSRANSSNNRTMKMEVLARNQFQAAQFDGIGSTKATDWTKPLTPPTSAIQHQQQQQQQNQLPVQVQQQQQQQQQLSQQDLQPTSDGYHHHYHHHHHQHHQHQLLLQQQEDKDLQQQQQQQHRNQHQHPDDSAISDLSLSLQSELRLAKSRNLACTEVLLPADLLDRIATDMVQMAEKEPCGIRGCAVYIEFEDEPGNSRRIASLQCGAGTVATFELYLTLRNDQSGWTAKLPQFLKNLARRSTIIISPDYTLIKNKLYNSFLE